MYCYIIRLDLKGEFMNLERAIQIVVEVHVGAKVRGGKAYILHPISVIMRCGSDDEKSYHLFLTHE